MAQSESINELVAALSKAQGEMETAKFNKKGHTHRYADFTSVIHACRGPLAHNNLAIMQYVEIIDKQPMLVTMLTHISGQWITSNLPLLVKDNTCQSLGSAMTYMKRYGLSALLGIVSDEDEGADDDGETAMGRGKNTQKQSSNDSQITTTEEKISKAEIVSLTNLMQNLNEESRKSFLEMIKTNFKSNNLQDIPKTAYDKCFNSLNAKIKFLKDQEKTATEVAV